MMTVWKRELLASVLLPPLRFFLPKRWSAITVGEVGTLFSSAQHQLQFWEWGVAMEQAGGEEGVVEVVGVGAEIQIVNRRTRNQHD